MRTLQEKYNAIQQGKFSKDHFLAEARMQQPQLVTRFNGYNDAVQILKNRGMIKEGIDFSNHSDDAIADMIVNLSRYEGNEQEIKIAKDELARRKGNVDEISADTFKSAVDVAKGRGEDRRASKLGSTFLNSFVEKPLMGGTISKIDIQKPSWGDYFDVTLEVLIPTQGTDGMYDKPKYLYYDVENDDWGMKGKGLEVTRQDARVLSQIAIKINPDTKYGQGTQHFDIIGMNEAKQPKATKKGLADYRYKPTNEMDKYPYEQILRGLRVELEGLGVQGTPTAEQYAKSLAKVSKNLAKDPIFYTNQVAGVNPNVDLHDQMVTATAKNTVDTFNGMKKAALKEGFKKLIKKVLSEDAGRASRGVEYGQPNQEENDFYSDLKNYKDEKQQKPRFTYNDHGDFGDETEFGDEPEEREMFEMYGEDSIDESKVGDLYILAQESEGFEDFVRAVEREYGRAQDTAKDIEQLEYIFNSARENGYDDENFSDPFIDGEEEDDISHPRGYEEASDEEDFDDLFESVTKTQIQDAIQAIVTYHTLPSQIDHRRPWQTKADRAEEFLQSLPNGDEYLDQAREQIDSYYTQDTESGMSSSDYDELFESVSLKDIL